MDRRGLLFPCGLVVGTSYLSSSTETSFAFDRPLHTAGALLLFTGLTLVAFDAITSRKSRETAIDPYEEIPLRDGSETGFAREPPPPPPDERPVIEKVYMGKAGAVILLLVSLVLCLRAAIFWRITKSVQCSAPTPSILAPLMLAISYDKLNPKPEQTDTPPKAFLDAAFDAIFRGPNRYILPALLFTVSTALINWRSGFLRSSYICPIVPNETSLLTNLQLAAFILDWILLAFFFIFVTEHPVHSDRFERQLSTRNNGALGWICIVSSAILAVAGIIVFTTQPEHRDWFLQFPFEYMHHLLRLSIMIPCTILFFLFTSRTYGVMGSILIVSFSIAYTGVLQAFQASMFFSFSPMSTAELALYTLILTLGLALYTVADGSSEGHYLPRIHIRPGKISASLILILVLVLYLGGYGYRPTLLKEITDPGHPVATLVKAADIWSEEWIRQAKRSRSLPEAVQNYHQRYSRDPPPGFDKWYEFATSHNSVVIDDFDNIEEDLAPFVSLSPWDLRQRTAEILAEGSLGGIRIRNGTSEVIANVPDSHRWMVDGTTKMLDGFIKYLPDMDLAINLNDEPRVTVPFADLEEADLKRRRARGPSPDSLKESVGFSPNRASVWWDLADMPPRLPYFKGTGFRPTFTSYGSVACSSSSHARKYRWWNTRRFCLTCTGPHSMGVFVANWSESANPCHQPDLANLHGLHLSPSSLVATHALVPVFSQSRPPGYADIRFPSPWNYMDKTAYSFDEKYPDPPFIKKENTLFWRGTTTEGVSPGTQAWRGMLRQRLVHLVNNETEQQVVLLPSGAAKFSYTYTDPEILKEQLETRLDVRFVNEILRCGEPDCSVQSQEFGFGNPVDFKDHWRYKYLFDADGAGFSGRFIPFLRSNSVVFKTALYREWYEGRLIAWKHFIPVDLRLHDIWSSIAYFGGYGLKNPGDKKKMETRDKEAEKIARESKVWSEKVLRKEDMEIYMFRLLLEWGRLTDERRVELGFRLEGKGKGERSEEL